MIQQTKSLTQTLNQEVIDVFGMKAILVMLMTILTLKVRSSLLQIEQPQISQKKLTSMQRFITVEQMNSQTNTIVKNGISWQNQRHQMISSIVYVLR